jgi:hypothetical protein
MLRREDVSVWMDDESGAPTPLRLLGFQARLGVTVRNDSDLDDGRTRVIGESDIGTTHTIKFGLAFTLRGITPDRRGRSYKFVGWCSRRE